MATFHVWTSMSRESQAIPLEASTAYIAARSYAMSIGIHEFIPWEDDAFQIVKGMLRYDLNRGLDHLPFFAIYVKEF